MSAISAPLLRDLQREVAAIERDMRDRLASDPDVADVAAGLRAEHDKAFAFGRTAVGPTEWMGEQITQAAVGWVLGTVFVRFCEDNTLVKGAWLAAGGDPTTRAGRTAELAEAHERHFRDHPLHNDRDWITAGFTALADLPATAGIFDRRNPLWRIPPSGDAATRLIRFWRRTGDDGGLVHDFTDPKLDTRFLGDLYQHLSETARKRYALLQTPEFVEEFILDRTLSPALEERGFDGLRLIDPTCGSGHFLLGAFKRLFDAWTDRYPGMYVRDRVRNALDSIHGVDLNPFAVEIARFRLTVAALLASGLSSLDQAPAFDYHLAVGDSLLHGDSQQALDLGPNLDADAKVSGFAYAAEDLAHLKKILCPGRYDVVVGNPPYITVDDEAIGKAYKRRYPATCHGQYHLSAPFTQRFFQLARDEDDPGRVGLITDNAFMKREYGEKLITEFLARRDLVEVVDTSGAFIPGHGTPTVILVGRNQPPAARTLRVVLGLRGEPGEPDNPAEGKVWSAIVAQIDQPGSETRHVKSIDLDRKILDAYPWTLGAGLEAKLNMEKRSPGRLGRRGVVIGRTTHTGVDPAFFVPSDVPARQGIANDCVPVVLGENVRDGMITPTTSTLFPYDDMGERRSISDRAVRMLWPSKPALQTGLDFGQTRAERGLRWFDHSMFFPARYRMPLSIAFAFVSTHNHFVMDRGGKVFNRTAPTIKLPAGRSEEEYLQLVGLLGSSTACFWLKQVCHDRGIRGEGGGFTSSEWERFFEFTSTKLEQFPLPAEMPLDHARRLDALAEELSANLPAAVCAIGVPTREALAEARSAVDRVRGEMIAVQEELDWAAYRLYGLIEEDLTCSGDDLPCLALGERAFEIVLAQRVENGEEESGWFDRHGSEATAKIPAGWASAYRDLVQRRIDTIEDNPHIGLIERPEFKRRWHPTFTMSSEDRENAALKVWLLDRLEDRSLWFDGPAARPATRSAGQLAERLAFDPDFKNVLALYLGSPDFVLSIELSGLLESESVPYLAALRYTEDGLRKRVQWEEAWDLQRKQDRGEEVGKIVVPQKYASRDFRGHYWTHRGKLDVPKERFIAYPTAPRDGDPTPVYGWAGWDHAQQAFALAAVIVDRTNSGWGAQSLVPLLAGIAELEPWLHQWHSDVDPTYGASPAAYLSNFLRQRLADLALTPEDLRRWRPAKVGRSRRTG